jgi:hypothetical protein
MDKQTQRCRAAGATGVTGVPALMPAIGSTADLKPIFAYPRTLKPLENGVPPVPPAPVS